MSSVVASANNFYIPKKALQITLNALSNKDYLDIVSYNSSKVYVYMRDVVDSNGHNLGRDEDGNNKTWNLEVAPTYFEDTDARWLYLAVSREGQRAILAWPKFKVDVYGKTYTTQDGATEEQLLPDTYFYIKLGKVSSSASGAYRQWAEDIEYGILETDAGREANVQGNFLRKDKDDSTNYTLGMAAAKIKTYFILGTNTVRSIVTSAKAWAETTFSDEAIGSISWVKKYFINKSEDDSTPHTLTIGNVIVGKKVTVVSTDEGVENETITWSEGNLDVKGKADITGNATIGGNATISGTASITGDTTIGGDADISGDATVGGELCVTDDATIGGDADVSGKVVTDTVEAHNNGNLSVNQNVVIDKDGGIKHKDFEPDILIGQKWQIDKEGDAEMRSLILRQFLEVPELRYNRVTVESGTTWNAAGAGIIKRVGIDETLNEDYFDLKLETGEVGSFVRGDICMGIWHFSDEEYTNVNATKAQEDADKSGLTVSGFCRVEFIVTRVSEYTDDDGTFANGRVYFDYKANHKGAVKSQMTIVGYGHDLSMDSVDADGNAIVPKPDYSARTRSWYATKKFQRYIYNMDGGTSCIARKANGAYLEWSELTTAQKNSGTYTKGTLNGKEYAYISYKTDKWAIQFPYNVAMHLGDTEGMSITETDGSIVNMGDYSAFLSNIYMYGIQRKLDINELTDDDHLLDGSNNFVLDLTSQTNTIHYKVVGSANTPELTDGNNNYIAYTGIVLRNGTDMWVIDTEAEDGNTKKFSMEVIAHNCTYGIEGANIWIESIAEEAYTSGECYVKFNVVPLGADISIEKYFYIRLVCDGRDGQDADGYVADLSNQMSPVPCDTDSRVSQDFTLNTKATMSKGISPLTTSVSVLTTSINVNGSNVALSDLVDITGISTNAEEHDIVVKPHKTSGAFPIFPATLEITFRLTCVSTDEHNGKTKDVTFSIMSVMPGADGKSPTIYELQPSVSSVAFKQDATDPTKIESGNKTFTVGLKKAYEEGLNVITTGSMPTGITIRYTKNTEANASSPTYSLGSNISVANTDKFVSLALFNGSTLMDRETVPVLLDGEKGEDGEGGYVVDMSAQSGIIKIAKSIVNGSVVNTFLVKDEGNKYVATTGIMVTFGTEPLTIQSSNNNELLTENEFAIDVTALNCDYGRDGSDFYITSVNTAALLTNSCSLTFTVHIYGVETPVVKTFVISLVDDGKDGNGVEYVFYAPYSTDGYSENNKPAINATIADASGRTSASDEYLPTVVKNSVTQTGTRWTDEPIGVATNRPIEFYAQRKKVNGTWQSFGDVHIWNKYTTDGSSPYLLDLSNEVTAVPVDGSGNVLSSATIEPTEVYLMLGSKFVYSDFKFYVETEAIDCYKSNSYTEKFPSTLGNALTSISSSFKLYPLASSMSSEQATVTIVAVNKNNSTIVLRSTYTINKSKAGADAVVFELLPDFNIVHLDADGTPKSDCTTFSARVKKVSGATTSIIEYANLYSKNLKLQISTNGGSFADVSTWNTASILNGSTYFDVALVASDNANKVYDRERIHAVKDGEQGPQGEQGADGENGKSIDRVVTYYTFTNNKVTAPTEYDTNWYESYTDAYEDEYDASNGIIYLWKYEIYYDSDNAEIGSSICYVEPGKDGADGKDGSDGKSAYELAVEGGYSGTQAEWLESLKGATGVGQAGAILRPRGFLKVSNAVTYYNNSDWVDYVRVGNLYWKLGTNIRTWNPNQYTYVDNGVTKTANIATDYPTTSTTGNITTNGLVIWQQFQDMGDIAAGFVIADSANISEANMGEAFIGKTSGGVSVDTLGNISVDDTTDGWLINGANIRHTKTGLTLTSDGYLIDPMGLHIKVANNSDGLLNEYLSLKTITSHGNIAVGNCTATLTKATSTNINGTTYSSLIENHKVISLFVNSVTDGDKFAYVGYSGNTVALTPNVQYTFYVWVRNSAPSTMYAENGSYCIGEINICKTATDKTTTNKTNFNFHSAPCSQTSKNGITYTCHGIVATYNGWKKIAISFTPTSTYSYFYWIPKIRPLLAGAYAVYGGAGLVQGSVANTEGTLKDTGIDIANRKILLTSDNLVCENNNGEKTMWLDSMGNLTTAGVQKQQKFVVDSAQKLGYVIIPSSGQDSIGDGNASVIKQLFNIAETGTYNVYGMPAVLSIDEAVTYSGNRAANVFFSLDMACSAGVIDFRYPTTKIMLITLPMFKVADAQGNIEFINTPTTEGGTLHYMTLDDYESLLGRKLFIINNTDNVMYIDNGVRGGEGNIYAHPIESGGMMAFEFTMEIHTEEVTFNTNIPRDDGSGKYFTKNQKYSLPSYYWKQLNGNSAIEFTASYVASKMNNKISITTQS